MSHSPSLSDKRAGMNTWIPSRAPQCSRAPEFRPALLQSVPRCCRSLAWHQRGVRQPSSFSRGHHASRSSSQADAHTTATMGPDTSHSQAPEPDESAASSTPSDTSEPVHGASSSSSSSSGSSSGSGSAMHLTAASQDPSNAVSASGSSTGSQPVQQEPSPSSSKTAESNRTPTSYYRWPRQRSAKQRPMFLDELPLPSDMVPNLISFLGARDSLGGKYYVPRESYPAFLSDYLAAFQSGYAMFLAERYLRDPYRYFIELDFMWELDMEVVESVTNKVIDIVNSAVEKQYLCRKPRCLVSMRTPYKIHLNFPDVITTEPLACKCRDMVAALCQEKLGATYPLDWERIVDFPHGSFRLLGSLKTRQMDSDPAWVRDKAYYPVAWSEEEQRWKPRGVHYKLLCDSSIQPTLAQLQAFESSALFRDMAYDDIDSYHRKLEDRRKRRAERAEQDGTRRDPIKVKVQVQEDGYVRVRVVRRQWARSDGELRAVMEEMGLLPAPREPNSKSDENGEQHADDAAGTPASAADEGVDGPPASEQAAE